MFRKTIAAIAIALAAAIATPGIASADEQYTPDPSAIVTNTDGGDSHKVGPDDGYVPPGVVNCPVKNGESAAWTGYEVVDHDDDGGPVYANVCHYGDVNQPGVQL